MALGTNTDPYQPIEREQKLTRRILEVLAAYNHPFGIVTKSDLVLRDADIIAPMAEKGMAVVTLSVTTLDRDLARKLEPRAPTPPKRLAAIGTLAALGIPTGVLTAPMIPALNDMELERILEAAAKAGASGAGYVLLRLPLEIADLFKEWLETHYPDKADHVLSLVEQTRDGAMYDSRWGQRAVGSGPYADLLNQRFKLALRKYGLDRRSLDLDLEQFERPPQRAISWHCSSAGSGLLRSPLRRAVTRDTLCGRGNRRRMMTLSVRLAALVVCLLLVAGTRPGFAEEVSALVVSDRSAGARNRDEAPYSGKRWSRSLRSS